MRSHGHMATTEIEWRGKTVMVWKIVLRHPEHGGWVYTALDYEEADRYHGRLVLYGWPQAGLTPRAKIT